jgi:DNA gyrase subunit B
VTVVDNGRGIPVDCADRGKPAAKSYDVLHAGGKFDNDTYKVSGGLHGVGVSVVNALRFLDLEIWRDGRSTRCASSAARRWGVPPDRHHQAPWHQGPLQARPDGVRGPPLVRHPLQHLRELAFLNEGVTIQIEDERAENRRHEFMYKGGIASFVEHLNKNKTVIHPKPIHIRSERDGLVAECALQYNDSYNEIVFSFANSINTMEGGTHLSGFRSALTGTINRYATRAITKEQVSLSGETCARA